MAERFIGLGASEPRSLVDLEQDPHGKFLLEPYPPMTLRNRSAKCSRVCH